MITWFLFIIILGEESYVVSVNSIHQTMGSCFVARDAIMTSAPKPKINYEAVCIKSDRVNLL